MTPAVAFLLTLLVIGVLVRYIFYRRQRLVNLEDIHGCRLAPKLPNKRPFGVDRLEQIFRAEAEFRLMGLYLSYFRQVGTSLELKFLGAAAFWTMEPANLEAMLSTHFNDFGIGPRRVVSFPLFGDGVFTQDGSEWKRSRHWLRPQLQHKQFDNLEVFRSALHDLIQIIQREKGVVDLQPLFFRLTLDITTRFLFGESVQSLSASEAVAGERTFATAFDAAQKWITKRFRFLAVYWLVDGREFREACRDVREFADRIIDRNLSPHRQRDDKGHVFLDSMAQITTDRVALRGHIINPLVAGRDTTACLLSWTFFLLVRHPQAMEKLRAEINVTCGARSDFGREDLRRMSYLQSVLSETLRLYPPVPVNSRTAVRTTVLPRGDGPGGKLPILIPKGSTVAFTCTDGLASMEAELFRPERWQEDMPLQADPTSLKWGYLPFLGGPRTCLGMDFALAEAGFTIVRLLQSFPVIKLPGGEKVALVGTESQMMTLVISIKDGCKVETNQV